MNLCKNLVSLKSSIPADVGLVAVSKTQDADTIKVLYDCGQRVFGENKVQELVQKHSLLPSDIQWHFIGHLQSNKVKNLLPCVSLVHSVDSFRLLETINHESAKISKVTECLLQFHIATEETKFGLSMPEADEIFSTTAYINMKNVKITGVMGMATFTRDSEQVREEFRSLRHIFTDLKMRFFDKDESFRHISMGMSDDYSIAIEEGSTLIRVGTAIFGARRT